MLSKLFTATMQGLNAIPVTMEVNCSDSTMPHFIIVGLPDNAVKESQERVLSALNVNGYNVPVKKTVVNLAPADVRKEGSGFDLPMAIGLMMALEKLDFENPEQYMFIGELGLDGTILPVKGALPISIKARSMGLKALFVPVENAREAAVVDRLEVYGVHHICEVIDILNGVKEAKPTVVNTREEFYEEQLKFDYDFSEVKGQENVKRAFEVAAAGGHNIILVGSPGCGKSMMAKRLPSILPPLSLGESLETTQIHSVAGKLKKDTSLISQRPFRAPHHTISDVALVGGGTTFMPGEICLAHNGVLFLDELPEFSRASLEVLRQPIEDSSITISRAGQKCTYPCTIMVIAAMNPCPCGFFGDPKRRCTCSEQKIRRYLNRVSGPLLDRFDIHVEVPAVEFEELRAKESSECSADIKKRVNKAREIQQRRFEGSSTTCNAKINASQFERFCVIDKEAEKELKNAFEKLGFTARAYDRVLKVARTIAELDGEEIIQSHHVLEAIQYRSLDRKYWES